MRIYREETMICNTAAIRWVIGCALWGMVGLAHARGDGLLNDLPRDGSWTLYDVRSRGDQRVKFDIPEGVAVKGADEGPKKLDHHSTLKISSVGSASVDGRRCRWIEIESKSKAEGVHPRILLKALIPEEDLKGGKDPFAHVVWLYFQYGDDEPQLVADPKRKTYELDRFRYLLLPPVADVKRLPERSIATELGNLNCNVLRFHHKWKGTLSQDGSGTMAWDYGYLMFTTPKVPFGVAVLELEGISEESNTLDADGKAISFKLESKNSFRLEVSRTGTDAVTGMPGVE